MYEARKGGRQRRRRRKRGKWPAIVGGSGQMRRTRTRDERRETGGQGCGVGHDRAGVYGNAEVNPSARAPGHAKTLLGLVPSPGGAGMASGTQVLEYLGQVLPSVSQSLIIRLACSIRYQVTHGEWNFPFSFFLCLSEDAMPWPDCHSTCMLCIASWRT